MAEQNTKQFGNRNQGNHKDPADIHDLEAVWPLGKFNAENLEIWISVLWHYTIVQYLQS